MTLQDHKEWIESKVLTEQAVKMKELHYGKQGFIDNVNTLAIINWVLESAIIKEKV